jgi:proteasome alpha subunit
VTDERAAGAVVALRYDHGVLLAAAGQVGGSCRLDSLYGRIAVGACGSSAQVDRFYRAGSRIADIRVRYRQQSDVSARTLTFAYASALARLTAESPGRPDVQLLVADASDFHEVGTDGRVIAIDHCAAIGRDAESILEELSRASSGDLDLDAACWIALDALGRRGAGVELAGIDDRRTGQRFFRVPSDLVERARCSRGRAGGLSS